MNTLSLTRQQVDAVYATVSNICGAPVQDRDVFHLLFPECGEYRFMGRLGLGGKVYADGLRVWVDADPQDSTLEVVSMIAKANAAIARITETTDGRQLKLIVLDAMGHGNAAMAVMNAICLAVASSDWPSVGHLLLVMARYDADAAATLTDAFTQTGRDLTPDPDEAAWIAALPPHEGAST